jgi:dihydroxyacetone kinase DhaKLM complex PTS-EIIA-like component DhaM
MERVQFITHRGTKVLKVDLSHGASVEDNIGTLHKVKTVISTKPPRSLLILMDVTKTRFNISAVEELKNFSKFITPFVKASAVMGAVGIIYDAVVRLVGRDIARFDTEEQALDWLAEQ